MEFRNLRADEIDVRVGAKVGRDNDILRLLLYKDSRVDMSVLDETVGSENWQRSHEVINGNLFCNVGIRFSREDGYSEWVWKQDVGTESNTEKEKGQASDSFKRACTNWGIGRELYTAPDIVFYSGEYSAKDGKPTERFKCTAIEIENKRIKSVTILAEKIGKSKTFKQDVSVIGPTKGGIDREKYNGALAFLKNQGVTPDSVASRLGIDSLEDMTADQWNMWVSEYHESKEAK